MARVFEQSRAVDILNTSEGISQKDLSIRFLFAIMRVWQSPADKKKFWTFLRLFPPATVTLRHSKRLRAE